MKMADNRIYVNLTLTRSAGLHCLKWLALPAMLWLFMVNHLICPHFKMTVNGS